MLLQSLNSPELVDLDALLGHMLEQQRLEPFGGAMVVVALYLGLLLLKTDVVEAGKRGTINLPYRVIGHQEVLLPPHKHVIAARQPVVVKVVRVEVLGKLAKV